MVMVADAAVDNDLDLSVFSAWDVMVCPVEIFFHHFDKLVHFTPNSICSG
jgi:hypothetical protein